MQNYYAPRLEMQIPQENRYFAVTFDSDFDREFDKLSKDYKIHKKHEVKEFIRNNPELIDYIQEITPLIDKFFPKYLKCITFCQDYEFEELNDITIYINSTDETFEQDSEKFDDLETEIIKLNNHATKIKKLLSMDLWFLK